MPDARLGPLVDVRHDLGSTLVDLVTIEAIYINHRDGTAYVRLASGRRVPCTNPGAVRDAWRAWKLRGAPVVEELEGTPLLDRMFSAFEDLMKKVVG